LVRPVMGYRLPASPELTGSF